ncbi:TRAP dicarboxylate transporter, DctM subunit [Flexistipes sinusarabici DSM 4947]|uniref:TRAP dicarboxylate transporter, DctM subunit n=1 Tax=Flexistipes sinusarabici (strain ATCC 49648 / DSM 4947 / MAS 10) TaxID=717231 RepID=F8E725_FLESM|nr:TRAP transporter large permease subunit [Flexistipes sinusarabici]AEI14888.1 TRAP dicarboxylate transporter, DctM subunit [Flexistipes sinusarabici DSM 4947]
MVGIIMFFAALLLLLFGFPVAFTFGGVSVVFAIIYGLVEVIPFGGTIWEGVREGMSMFSFMPFRLYAIMTNKLLMAVPLFIFMGLILQKSNLAERLLESMGSLFGNVRGGMAISTVLVGALLAASTGVVGASVVAMGIISLPVMLKYNYNKELSTGTICAAGTLGQIIPPSIVLIILGDVFQLPVGDVFKAAFIPGLWLVGLYLIYIIVVSFLRKELAPPVVLENRGNKIQQIIKALIDILPPLILIVLVLGSIFAGIATPTESAAVGCFGAIILALLYRQFSYGMVKQTALETVKITVMVYTILIGATAFSMVFVYTGGDAIVRDVLLQLPGEKYGFIIFSMIAILILGFFIDFIEISYIIVPILLPVADHIGLNPLWFAILIAMNLQTSFLTPPFGFSLFYLKGVSPPTIKTYHIYRGVVPFITIQIIVLLILAFFPQLFFLSSG